MGNKRLDKNRSCFFVVWFSGFLILSAQCQEQLASLTRALRVARGSTAFLQPEDIVFSLELTQPCKIKVDTESSVGLSVGEMRPKVFPCNFPRNLVRYAHNGNPLLHTDLIRLVVYYFDAKETVTQDLRLSVIVDSSDNLIFDEIFLLKPLIVGRGSEFSGFIDSTVLRFKYPFFDEAICTVTSYEPKYHSQSLLHGSLVTSDGLRLSNMTVDCRDFLSSNLRYKHNGVSTTSNDYIMLHAEVEEPHNGIWKHTSEAIFLPVHILTGSKNTPPKVSQKKNSTLEINQFSMLILSSDIVWFIDAETPARNLVINITKPLLHEGAGFFVHIHEPWQPLRTFLQDDVAKRLIAYRPPNVSATSRKTFEVSFTAVDSHFLCSDPISFQIDVLSVKTTSPAVSHNTELVVINRGSSALTLQNLRVVDSDNINEVELHVRSGLHHGTLSVNGNPATSFKVSDIEQHHVIYKHNGGNSMEDKIILRITDRKSTVRVRFVISILPDEETLPQLVTNRSLDIFTDKYVLLTPYHLSAKHRHFSDAEIMFNVTTSPKYGNILKLRHPLTAGYPTSVFSQRDLIKGSVWFSRTVSETFEGVDYFQFTLQTPYSISTNVTETYSFEIHVKSYTVNHPPQLAGNATMHIGTNESDPVRLTKEMLSYKDPEKSNDSVFYTVTCSPFFAGNALTLDAGKLVTLDHAATFTRNTSFPTVHSFTQAMIDQNILLYIPPKDDIGTVSTDVQFVFSVSDHLGNTVRNQRFNITLLPVNNQLPHVSIKALKVLEGGTLLLNSKVITISDVDTPLDELVMKLEQVPKSGYVFLEEGELIQNGTFRVNDLAKSSLRYVHDGSQTSADEMVLTVSDGEHVITKSVSITIILSSLLMQQHHHQTIDPVIIKVDEAKEVIISPKDLWNKSIDSIDNSMLIYEIIRSPERGEFRVGGLPSDHFLGSELTDGSVSYRHTSGEIGQVSAKDSTLIMVSRDGQNGNYSLVEVSFVISPVDNVPPQLMLGSPLLVGHGKTARLTSEVISAWDLDSSDNSLTFVVFRMPVWGSLVKSRSSRSERSNSRHSITSFTMSDLKEGSVQYIQSHLPDGGPPSDSFFIYATDGKQNSTPGKVEVTVMKNLREQQAPFAFEVDDLIVDEGSQKAFSIQLNQALVGSRSNLILSLADSPSNGQVILVMNAYQNNGVKEMVFREVAVLELLSGIQLVYQHDGSETSNDQFILVLSSGSHSFRRVVYVHVTPVNDARPEIIRNEVLRVKFGDTEVIGNQFLKAVDADNPENQVQYIIVSLPRKGILELDRVNSGGSSRKELKTGMSFTQMDVNSNRLRYTHTRSLGDLPKDNFIFQLTDSKNFVSHETFEIEIVRSESETVIVHNHEMVIEAGASKAITSDILSIVDSDMDSSSIQFLITKQPAFGVVEMYRNKTGNRIPVSRFTQTELDQRVIFYSHLMNSSTELNDSFTFSVKGPKNETISSGYFRIHINQSTVLLPVLESNVPLMVIHGSQAPITSSNLKMSCHNCSALNLVYAVVESPHYGKILINDTTVRNFTQKDIDNSDVFYKSESTDESMMDYFLFTIYFQSPIENQPKSMIERKPQFFNILIQPISKIAPTVEKVRPLTSLVAVNGGDQHGFILTSRHLSSTHPLFGADDLVYHIREKSNSGYFENRGTKRMVRKRFTQKDIDEERIAFVLNGDVRTTDDRVTLRVTDPNRNAVDNVRLEMYWSLIEWSQAHYIVCEDIHLLPLIVRRRGITNHSSSVQVRTKSMSARERMDYIPRSNATISFSPGVSEISWMVEITNDGIREGREERFKVVLRNATTAILGPTDKTIVQLIDYGDGHCMEYIGMISKNRKEPQSPGMQNIPLRNISKSHTELPSTLDSFDSNDEDEYEDYFSRFEDSHPTLLESNLSFYNGGNHENEEEEEYETKEIVEPENNRRIGIGKDSASTTGFGKNLQSHEPRKPNRSIRRDKSTPYQKSKNKLSISQPCTQDTKGLLYLDLPSSKMFRCSGEYWQPWSWGNSGKAPTMLKDSSAEPESGEILKMENFMPALREDVQRTNCPSGWTSYNNSCFMASAGRLDWIDAEATCRKDGAHLTHIQSRDHLAWLWSLNDQSQFWIGMHRRDDTGQPTWQYTDSTQPFYFNWRVNYPCTKCRSSHCVAVGNRMEFMNKSCDKVKMKYVCVQSPRPNRRSLMKH